MSSVLELGAAIVGAALLLAWVAGVSGAFGATVNWTLFLCGSAVLLLSRAFALRESRR